MNIELMKDTYCRILEQYELNTNVSEPIHMATKMPSHSSGHSIAIIRAKSNEIALLKLFIHYEWGGGLLSNFIHRQMAGETQEGYFVETNQKFRTCTVHLNFRS